MAYKAVQKKLDMLLEINGILIPEDTSKSFVDLCALHFPEKKVAKIAQEFCVMDAKLSIKLDNKSEDFKESIERNAYFKPLIQLTSLLTQTQMEKPRHAHAKAQLDKLKGLM